MTVDSIRKTASRVLAERGHFDEQAVHELIDKAKDWWHVSSGEAAELKKLLAEHGDRFEDDARRRLESFLATGTKSSPLERLAEIPVSVPAFIGIGIEAIRGSLNALFSDGTASAADVARVREAARRVDFHATAGLAKIDPRGDLRAVEAALRKSIRAIDGYDFLSKPPAGRSDNAHTVLIKPGVNWGAMGYPSVTSWESVFALTKLTFEEAARRGATVDVIVGDESGIEIKAWGGSTLANMEHTGILHGAVLAGLERAAMLERGDPGHFGGAGQLLERARQLEKIGRSDRDLIEMAEKAGVRVIGFEQVEHTRVPVPGAQHFKDGVLLPKIVVDEVTDIINLPKPPGRHIIMGCSGLTGAMKNHVGLLGGADRTPALHGPFARLPARYDGEDGDSFVDRLKGYQRSMAEGHSAEVARAFAHDTRVDLDGMGPGMAFQEKLVELYLAVKDKERFSATDMRRTLSSIGPDLGDAMDVGAVIAAKDPTTVDLLASGLLKNAYQRTGGLLDAARPGGDSVSEYLAGTNWLGAGNAFDLTSHIAANAYGIGPVDRGHIDLPNLAESGFSADEIAALEQKLGG